MSSYKPGARVRHVIEGKTGTVRARQGHMPNDLTEVAWDAEITWPETRNLIPIPNNDKASEA